MQIHWYEIMFVLASLIISSVDWYMYKRFTKLLAQPFKDLTIDLNRIDPVYNITDTLYQSYKKIPPGKFKLVKLSVRSQDVYNSPINHIIDVFVKLVLTLLLAVMGASITISVALLGFLNNSSELKKDYHSWVVNVTEIIDGFKNGQDAYLSVIFIGIVLFSVSLNHILLSYRKKDTYKRHITIIEEIEKERA